MFLLMYAVYIILMYFNRSIEAWVVPKFPRLGHDLRQTSVDLKLSNLSSFDDMMSNSNEFNDVDIGTDNTGRFSL